jgi:hypothetical protein
VRWLRGLTHRERRAECCLVAQGHLGASRSVVAARPRLHRAVSLLDDCRSFPSRLSLFVEPKERTDELLRV